VCIAAIQSRLRREVAILVFDAFL